jgi:CheY-like chemotaxis protein
VTNPDPTQPSNPAALPGEALRVLVIDDDDAIRSMLKELLESYKCVVHAHASPLKALEMFTREGKNFDVVLLDYYMPHMDGAKTFEWIRKINPTIKVLLCSGADELRLRQIQAQYKVDGYIRKPFRTRELISLLFKAAGRPVPAL